MLYSKPAEAALLQHCKIVLVTGLGLVLRPFPAATGKGFLQKKTARSPDPSFILRCISQYTPTLIPPQSHYTPT